MNLPMGMLVAHPRPLIVSLWLACGLRRVSAAACPAACNGHGSCLVSGLCACDAGYTSPDCSVKVCPGGCSGRGLCYDGTCFCEPGSAGSRCELDAHDCNFHGSYSPSTGRCECSPGWSGLTCEQPECTDSCSGHGLCGDGVQPPSRRSGRGRCVCETGYAGDACEAKQCHSTSAGICSGTGVCVDGHCHCPPGRTGPACEQLEQLCASDCSGHGVCFAGRCRCDVGWGGLACAKRQCAGLGQWTLTLCSGHGGCLANGTCACHEGWTGIDCSERVCAGGCGEHGVCHSGQCFCAPSYTGERCERRTCGVGANGLQCSGHGVCRSDGQCRCDKGWHGGRCEAASAAVLSCPSGCSEASGRGTCYNGTCWCLPGFTGLRCESAVCSGRPSECGAGAEPPRGSCVTQRGHLGRSFSLCQCQPGWTGADCELRECPAAPAAHAPYTAAAASSSGTLGWLWRSAPKPTPLPCSGRAPCSNGTCLCPPGFAGAACDLLACPNDCTQRGECVIEARRGAGMPRGMPVLFGSRDEPRPTCQCAPGFGGADCSVRVCAAPGATANCSGVGYCSVAIGNVCLCPEGLGGADCSQPACPPGCAAPRGQCRQGKCLCAVGWFGPACDRPMCDKACSGHGVCTLSGCRCDAGWNGQDCSQRDCGDHRCHADQRQGRCLNGQCVCALGFSGPACNSTCGADEAAPGQPLCSAHGVCSAARRCLCEPGYAGVRCERRTCLMGCSGRGLCHDGSCVCALGFGGPDCATTTVPSARDCATGCVHLCAKRCAEAPEGDGGGGSCFVRCRRQCAQSCQVASGQRAHWAAGAAQLLGPEGLLGPVRSEIGGLWEAPTADYTWAVAASAALGLRVPLAAALPNYDRWGIMRQRDWDALTPTRVAARS